ncbi:MAG: aminodeoxychorismate synthase component I [Desulfotomaculum sp.]|nr:aminodeoxychorismate synthase component I [Desulfotomaculum sp.]
MNVLPIINQIANNKQVYRLFEGLRDLPYGFMLDTSLYIKGLGRFTFIGADPFLVVTSKNGITGIRYFVKGVNKVSTVKGNPLQVLKDIMSQYKIEFIHPDIPFTGGAVGYFSYDFGRQFEKIPDIAEDDLQTPDFTFGFYDLVLAVDNTNNQTTIISTGLPYKGEKAIKRASERVQWIKNIIEKQANTKECDYTKEVTDVKCHFTKEQYQSAVARAINHILCGDIFQVNLSQRFELSAGIDGWELFKRLRAVNPAPFSAYLNFDPWQILCSSPERFLKLGSDREVQTCPIKGTRPRGSNAGEDLKNYMALKNSLKDKAELTMIIDLERNDLGRICEIGSVRAEDCFRIESYPTVHHLVATVKGKLPRDKDIFDLIRAAFPGGSITGAPKIKAMEIIERLEPVRRGIYTGSLGYIGFDGRADLNIVIRTIIKKNGRYYFQVGGGITADSDPEAEYYETLDKAKALMQALGLKRS